MSRSSDHRGDDLGNDQGALFSETPSRTGLSGTMASLTRPHRSVLLAGLTATTLASAAAILNTALVGRMVDATLRADLQAALGLAVLGILCAVVQVVCAGLGQAWLARAGERLVRDLRDTIVARLLLAPMRFMERHRAGDLVQRGTAEIASLSGFVRESLGQLVSTLTTLLAAVVVLSMESWLLLVMAAAGSGATGPRPGQLACDASVSALGLRRRSPLRPPPKRT